MQHVTAHRNSTTARFPLAVWKSGIPQKAGWQLLTEERSEVVIPKEIVDMSVTQKATVTEVPGVVKKKEVAAPVVKKEVKPKTVKRANKK